jgi:hypothetical protein
MPTIHVDKQVFAELRRRASGKSPNDVIRQLLGLSIKETESGETEPAVYLIPHSPKEKELNSADKLAKWMRDYLGKNGGEYNVASAHYWRNVVPCSVCLFHKNKKIVGEARLVEGLKPYTGEEKSPVTGKPYAGTVRFDPASVRVYQRPLSFSEAEGLLGKPLTWRAIQRLTLQDYTKIQDVLV